MKRLITGLFTLIMALVLLAPATTVMAKDKKAEISDAKLTANTLEISGTTEALAVAIQLRDADDNIVAMATTGTKDKAFKTKMENLSITEGKTYTIYVADFEGGTWTTKDVVYKKETPKTEEPKKEEKSPATGDTLPVAPMLVLFLGAGLCGLVVTRKSIGEIE